MADYLSNHYTIFILIGSYTFWAADRLVDNESLKEYPSLLHAPWRIHIQRPLNFLESPALWNLARCKEIIIIIAIFSLFWVYLKNGSLESVK